MSSLPNIVGEKLATIFWSHPIDFQGLHSLLNRYQISTYF